MQRFYKVLIDALELPDEFALAPEMPISTIPGWDSMAWISVIAGLEEITGKEFPLDGVDEIKTLGDLLKAIAV